MALCSLFFKSFIILVSLSFSNGFPNNLPSSQNISLNNWFSSPSATHWWDELNGAHMHYLQVNSHTFAGIQSQLDSYYQKGYRVISFFCVYSGVKDAFAGLGPIDYYQTQPTAGTLAQFQSLTDAAHKKGMAVMSWINLAYSTDQHKLWHTAQSDKGAGRTTNATRSFIWSKTGGGTGQFGWAYSSTANSYYKKTWGYPAFNYGDTIWQQEAKQIIQFWMGHGVDGFIIDAFEFMEKQNSATSTILKKSIGDTLVAGGAMACPEGSPTRVRWAHERNLLFTYDNDGDDTASHDDTNIAWDAIDDADASGIEGHVVGHGDVARSFGGGSFSYDPITKDNSLRPLEIALMTSIGVLYEMYFSNQNGYGRQTANMEKVLNAVNTNLAFQPAGSRVVLKTNSKKALYAVKKTSIDGHHSALCIFNFARSTFKAVINLAGSGITLGQQPIDAVTGVPGPNLTQSYSLTMAARSYHLFLIH